MSQIKQSDGIRLFLKYQNLCGTLWNLNFLAEIASWNYWVETYINIYKRWDDCNLNKLHSNVEDRLNKSMFPGITFASFDRSEEMLHGSWNNADLILTYWACQIKCCPHRICFATASLQIIAYYTKFTPFKRIKMCSVSINGVGSKPFKNSIASLVTYTTQRSRPRSHSYPLGSRCFFVFEKSLQLR